MNLERKHFIVTGGANGLGLAISNELVAKGAVVSILDVDRNGLEALKGLENIYPLYCDISQVDDVTREINFLSEKFGSIEGVINNAGVVANAPLLNLKQDGQDLEVWDKVISTNLSGAYYVTRATAAAMMRKRTQGVIVNVSSICAAGNAGQGAYSAAKAGLRALTVAWAKELSPLGIRVCGIAPGYVETRTTMESMSEQVIKDWKKKTPIRRMGSVDEIVAALMFVIGNNFYNGRTLEVDGGLRI